MRLQVSFAFCCIYAKDSINGSENTAINAHLVTHCIITPDKINHGFINRENDMPRSAARDVTRAGPQDATLVSIR